MNTNEHDNRKQVELLALARQQLNDEFIKNRNEVHAKWQRESEAAWLTNGKLLPYPSNMAIYPTEKEVVARALELYNKQTPPAVVTPTPTLTPVTEVPTPVLSPWQEHLVKEPVIEVPTPAPAVTNAQPSDEAALKGLLTKFLSLARELDAKKDDTNA
jgi:hypothetical protein